MDEKDGLAKIAIDLKDATFDFETLWAEPLADGLYKLRNVPFLAYGLSEQDIVNAFEIDGRLVLNGVAQRGGHSTYRLFFSEPTDETQFDPLWVPFGELGCTYERANGRLIGIDVPPKVDVYAVYELLKQGEHAEHWTFEEGHYGHPLR